MATANRSDPSNNPEWAKLVSRIVRTIMARSGVKFPELSSRLNEQFGTVQLENNLRSKVSRGTLGAQLLLQIIAVCEPCELDSKEIRTLLIQIRDEQKR